MKNGGTFAKSASSGIPIVLPSDKIYIYELEGELKGELELGESFLGNWLEDGSSFLFFSRKIEPQWLSEKIGIPVKNFYETTYGEWEAESVTRFKVGDVEIRPIWEGEEKGENEIVINPLVVFGSGSHPTTKGCLEAIWELRGEPVSNVLDLGTGTGILSLFSLKIFHNSKAFSVDKNPLCVRCALENARLNGLDGRMRVVCMDALDAVKRFSFDLLVANIPYEVILSLLEEKSFYRGRFYVLSGFMEGGGGRIAEEAWKRGLSLISSKKVDSWLVLTFSLA